MEIKNMSTEELKLVRKQIEEELEDRNTKRIEELWTTIKQCCESKDFFIVETDYNIIEIYHKDNRRRRLAQVTFDKY